MTLNVGNGMNSDGFVVPIAGHYRLSFSAIGALGKYLINTAVSVGKNGAYEFSILDSSKGNTSDGNSISHNWIWKLNKGDRVSLFVSRRSYLTATSNSPLNFNGQLVLVDTSPKFRIRHHLPYNSSFPFD